MNLSEQERTRIVRTWLNEGSSELSPRVHDAVLREFPRRRQDGAFGSWRMRMTASATVAVAAAAVVVVLLAGPRLLPGMMPGGVAPTATPPTEAPTPTPELIDRSYRDVGYIGLPPPDAIPSDPSRTELVETFLHPGGPPYKGAIFLYADGRLIWNEYYGLGFARSTGWLEQRLTVDGIELVRELAIQGPDGGMANRLDPVQLPDRLPASAWADETIRPYVPSRYGACLIANDGTGTVGSDLDVTLTEKLDVLPPEVAELLRNREPVPKAGDAYGDLFDCLGLTTAQARQLDAALREAGFDQDEWRNEYLLEYHLDLDGDGPGTATIAIWFEPVFPDGTITCSNCG